VADAASIPASHGRHDRLLVAAQADRPADRDQAPSALGAALVAACTECAELYADLVALAGALPGTAVPRRARDFRLDSADAERLRQRGLQAWLDRIGSSRDTLSKPLAIGFTTLGLAGLLLATAPTVLLLAGGGAAVSDVGTPAGAGASAIPTLEAMRAEASAAPSEGDGLQQHGGGSGVTNDPPRPGSPTPTSTPAAGDPIPVPVIVLSGGFLTLGGGLFVLRQRAGMRR
jgi:hypothetical protein